MTNHDALMTHNMTNEWWGLADTYGDMTNMTNHLLKRVNYRKREKEREIKSVIPISTEGVWFVIFAILAGLFAIGIGNSRHDEPIDWFVMVRHGLGGFS